MEIEQQRIRELREDKDLSQKQIAHILNKSQQGYAHIENGRAELSIKDLKILCDFYYTSSDYILGLTDITRPYPQSKTTYLSAARSKDNQPIQRREIKADLKNAPETDEDI